MQMNGEGMQRINVKTILIVLLLLWFLLFMVDSMFGIPWPNYTVERVFIWVPTVLIGVYWLLFGGKKGK
jgi:hypothetical protein